MEEWKNVNDIFGDYQASSNGRIRNTFTGRILRGHDNGRGYLYISLYRNKHRKVLAIHRLIALTFLPIDPERNQVNHKNGIKSDNRLENLEWCNGRENQLHRNYVLGKRSFATVNVKGLDNPRSYFKTIEELEVVFSLRKNGKKQKEIAKELKVSLSAIQRILTGKSFVGVRN